MTALLHAIRRGPDHRREPVGDEPRTAIIDIGSNSIRLVVYQGPARLPAILYNEKVTAGLGRGLTATGAIDAASLALAETGLARFAALARQMTADRLRVVATAAVRDASNGGVLLAAARRLGLSVELLSGEQEAAGAGWGVLSGIPNADGIVGDLGGGSLELVRVTDGAVRERASFPLGVLRVAATRAKGAGALDRQVTALVRAAGWSGRGRGLPLYLVGGSWRALAKLDMHLRGYPLPVIHQYAMNLTAVSRLRRMIGQAERGKLREARGVSGARAATLSDATALLAVLMRQLGSTGTVVSSFGLREGLLFQELGSDERRQDPLIVAARHEGAAQRRFAEPGASAGDLLHRWMAPLFADEPASLARLRHAACLLADVGWRAHPEFRAERGMETALHGSWVALDAAGRALLAQALWTSLGGGGAAPAPVPALADASEIALATRWGLAMRLGQRWSGGLAGPLDRSALALRGGSVVLELEPGDAALYSDTVQRRHQALAAALGLTAAVNRR